MGFGVAMSGCTCPLETRVLQLGTRVLQLGTRVLQRCCEVLTVGHCGCLKTLHGVIPTWWPLVHADIARYAQACGVYAWVESPTQKLRGLPQPLPVLKKPWRIISMDFVVDMPTSQGREAVLVVLSTLAKVAIFVPLKRLSPAPWTPRLFLQHAFHCRGLCGDGPRDVAHFPGLEAAFGPAGGAT